MILCTEKKALKKKEQGVHNGRVPKSSSAAMISISSFNREESLLKKVDKDDVDYWPKRYSNSVLRNANLIVPILTISVAVLVLIVSIYFKMLIVGALALVITAATVMYYYSDRPILSPPRMLDVMQVQKVVQQTQLSNATGSA